MKKALVIVHLSSLDAYADEFGIDKAAALVRRMKYTIKRHEGLVYVIDQGWPLSEPYSIPRQAFMRTMELYPTIQWRTWDERGEPWEKFLERFKHQLQTAKVTEIVLGGIWFDPHEGVVGCVTETYDYLKKAIPTKVDPSIVGCVPEPGLA